MLKVVATKAVVEHVAAESVAPELKPMARTLKQLKQLWKRRLS